MKFSLSVRTLKKILIGTTVINYIILIAYIFLIISVTFFESYAVFLLSLPAYVLSKSWMLILGFFGFEGLLLIYYWYKNKNTVITENLQETSQMLLDQEIIIEDSEIMAETDDAIEDYDINNPSQSELDIVQEIDEITSNEEIVEQTNTELIEAEKEFDRLWEEAINHVKSAYKKKAGESASINLDVNNSNNSLQETDNITSRSEIRNPAVNINHNLNKSSRAINMKSKLKEKKKIVDVSMIRDQHREFYNEVALNNWIYQKQSDRERVGLYKLSLDETKFREKEIRYLIDSGILHKMLIPFPSGAFVIYSLYEGEDKKIIKNYLAKLCKKNGLSFTEKSIAFVNYSDLGLDRKNWRFDFHINNSIVGVIWLSNFLIEDDQTQSVSLAYHQKKELKALLATAQINPSNKTLSAVIITDYDYNKEIIKKHIETLGFGQACICTVGEENFEKQIMKELNNKISV